MSQDANRKAGGTHVPARSIPTRAGGTIVVLPQNGTQVNPQALGDVVNTPKDWDGNNCGTVIRASQIQAEPELVLVKDPRTGRETLVRKK